MKNHSVETYEDLAMKLFSIPRVEFSFLLSFLSATLISFFYQQAIIFWFSITASAFLAVKFLKLKFNAKRVFFLSFLVTIISAVSGLSFGSPAGSFFLFLSVIYFCSESTLPVSSLYSTAVFLIMSPSPQTLVVCLLSTGAFAAYLKMMDRNVGVFNIKKFVKSFILFWLTSSPFYLEKALLTVSERKEGKVRCLRIGNVSIVSSSFHPGPFRNVGGATLVEKIRSRGAVYLHSPVTHTRNPVSGEDVDEIVSSIDCGSEIVVPMKPFRVEGEKFDVICFPFDKIRLFLVSGKEKIDDFSVNSDDFVVDCHNAHARGFDIGRDEVEEIKRLLERAKTMRTEPVKLKYAFFRDDFSSESVGSGIDVVVLDYGNERYVLIVFDSNNINLNFRKHLEREIAKVGYIPVVVSTDNHRKTGVRVKFSYKAAGDDDRDWKVAERLIQKLRDVKLVTADCSYGEREVEVNVMGENFFRDSEIAARKYSQFYITIFLFFMTLSFLATGFVGWL